MNINFHIERLILDGLPITRHQSPLVQAAIETELSRLLTERGITSRWQSGGAMPNVRAGGIQLTTESNPTQMGQQIAQAVYGGIGTAR
jgi:hypothetical protein